MDETLRIIPERWRSMAGSTARQHTITARRLSVSIASQSPGLESATAPNAAVPAEVTSRSKRPSSDSVCSSSASTALSWVTSVGMASARPWRLRISPATSARSAREREASATAAPSAANASAMARPIPRPAPVTSATLPARPPLTAGAPGRP